MGKINLVINICIDTIADYNLQRVRSAASTVISTCSGCNFVYAAMRNLGFTISKRHSIGNAHSYIYSNSDIEYIAIGPPNAFGTKLIRIPPARIHRASNT